MSLLIINRYTTKCGKCNRGADPHADTHDVIIEYQPSMKAGCGTRWTQVTSEYIGEGIEEAAKKMRPDLEWIDPQSLYEKESDE